MHLTTKLASAAVALVLAGSQAAIFAEEPGQARSATVGYADLNIASDSGEAAFMLRIHQAAKDVCGGTPVDLSLAVNQTFRNCHQVAIDNAMPQVQAALDRAHKAHVDIHEALNDTGSVTVAAPALLGASH